MIAAEVIRKFATDIHEPVLVERRKGFIVRFNTLAARLQNTLTYYQTILGSNLISDATNLTGKTGRTRLTRVIEMSAKCQ